MNRILILLVMLVVGNAYALPPCPSSSVWHNCFGTSFKDGSKYVGEWKDSKPNGQGTHTGSNGDKDVGEWKDGKFHGQGTMTHPDGNKYVGEYKDNKRHGQGAYTWADGSKYVGEHKNSLPWIGIMYRKDGSVFSEYQDGIEVSKQSYGSSTNNNVMDDTDKK